MSNKVESAERINRGVSKTRLALLCEKLETGEISLSSERLEAARKRVIKSRQEKFLANIKRQQRESINPHSPILPSLMRTLESQREDDEIAREEMKRLMHVIEEKVTLTHEKVIEEALRQADSEGVFDFLDLEDAEAGDDKSYVRAARTAIKNV